MIDLTTIENGTQLLIETKNAVYDVLIIDNSTCEVELSGGYKVTEPTKATLSGSVWASKKYPNEIRKNMTLEFFYADHKLTTAKVINVVIFEKDEEWYYDMGWNK